MTGNTRLVIATIAGLAASSAMAQDFYNQGAFQAAAAGNGCGQTWFEDFENTTPGYFVAGMNDPLTQFVANGPYAAGLVSPITVQSNLMGTGGASTNPRGGNALVAVEQGAGFGETSDIVTSNYFVDGYDLIINDPNVCAVGFNTLAIFGPAKLQIQVYDTGNNLLGTFGQNADVAGSNYFGFVSNTPIGRINLFDPSLSNTEGGDNIELWQPIPAPGTAALLGLGGLIGGRRRR